MKLNELFMMFKIQGQALMCLRVCVTGLFDFKEKFHA